MDEAMSYVKLPDTRHSSGKQGLKVAGEPTFPSPCVLGTIVYILSLGWWPHTYTTQDR